jgi:hypothetical protein
MTEIRHFPWQALSTTSATGTDRSEIGPYLETSSGCIRESYHKPRLTHALPR